MTFSSSILAQSDVTLTSLTIPAALKKNADAVVRYDDTRVVLSDIDKYEVSYSYAITILKNDGQGYLQFQAPYKEGSEKLNDIEISYYGPLGQLLKKVKSKELEDNAASSSIELIGDRRVKTFTYAALDFPVTIKVSYKKTSKNTMFLPRWMPINAYDLSIESSTYKLTNNSRLELMWSPRNFENFSTIEHSENNFEMSMQPRVSRERYTPSFYEMLPMLYVIPKQYSYEGQTGGHSNWEEFGYNMYRQFLKDKSNLNKPMVRNDLASKINADLDKRALIKALYDYVQEQTRYILITLGDGGFAPLSAQKVHDVKYGDCKALSFYMKSLLEMYNIPSNYVQIHADSDLPVDVFEDYAHTSPSNHIIINIPMESDTIWLDCTSHDNPFNYLGSFTDDRLACEIHLEGGKLVRTPRYTLSDNTQMLNSEVQLDKEGNINAVLHRESKGLFYEDGIGISKLTAEEMDEYLKTVLLEDFDRLEVKDQNYSLDENEILFDEKYEISASAYAEIAGDYMLIPIDFIDFPVPRMPKDKKRVNEIFFPRDRSFSNKTVYKIPQGFHGKIPEDKIIEDKYGSYKCSIAEVVPGTYEVSREFQQFKGRYAAEEYNSIKRFFDLIRKAETRKFSLSNKS